MWLWEVFNVNCPSPYSFSYPVLPSPNSVSHSFSIFHFQIHITNVLFILPPLTSHMVLFWFPDFEGTSVWTHILTELLLVLYKFIKFVLWQVQIIGLQGKEQDMVTGKRKKKYAPLFLWNGRGLRQEFHQTNADWTILQGSWLSPYLPRLEILHKTLCRFFLQCRLEPDTSNSGTSLSFSLFTYFYSRFTNI